MGLLNEPIADIPKHTQTLILFIFLAAKIMIAKAWKSPVGQLAGNKNKLSWIKIHKKLASIILDK